MPAAITNKIIKGPSSKHWAPKQTLAYTGQATVSPLSHHIQGVQQHMNGAMASRTTLLDLPEEVISSIARLLWDETTESSKDRVRSHETCSPIGQPLLRKELLRLLLLLQAHLAVTCKALLPLILETHVVEFEGPMQTTISTFNNSLGKFPNRVTELKIDPHVGGGGVASLPQLQYGCAALPVCCA